MMDNAFRGYLEKAIQIELKRSSLSTVTPCCISLILGSIPGLGDLLGKTVQLQKHQLPANRIYDKKSQGACT